MRRAQRVFWSSLDQGLSSVSNLLLSILVARVSGIEEFGLFGIAFAIYQLGLGSSRAFIGEPALIRIAKNRESGGNGGNLLGASLALGLPGLAICLAIAIVSGEPSGVFAILGVGFPVLMATDSCRYWLFALERPKAAVALDATWLAVQLGLYGLVSAFGAATTSAVLWTWVVGAFAGCLLFMIMQRAIPSVPGGWKWIKSTRDLSFRFWGEYLTISGTQQSIIYFSVIFSGVAASGALRGGQVVVGPLSMVSMGVAVVALPTLSRTAAAHSTWSLVKAAALVSGVLVTVTAAYAVTLAFIPASAGELLLGESWTHGAALVPLLLVLTAVSNLAYGATAGLRALEKARLTLRLRLVTLPIALGAILIGASQSPAGAVIGAILGSSLQLICWWASLLIIARSRPEGSHA